MDRIKPHDYAAPEGTFAVDVLRKQRHDPTVTSDEKVRAVDVSELTLDHYKTAFALQKKIYSSFGFSSTEELKEDFDPRKPVNFTPAKWAAPDFAGLRKEAGSLAVDQKIPSYMRSRFIIAIDELESRERWVSNLLEEAHKGSKSQEEMLRKAYRLVTGETSFDPNLISMTVSPISIHFICGDKETAVRTITSGERKTYPKRAENNGSPFQHFLPAAGSEETATLAPLEPDLLKNYINFGGMAFARVFRDGPTNTVTVGISDATHIRQGQPQDTDVAFETYRHELDHQLFNLRALMHGEQDNYMLGKYSAQADSLHKQLTLPSSPLEKRNAVLKLKELAAILYYYSNFEKFNGAVSAANEFSSQYLDRDSSYAEEHLLSEYYLQGHFPADIDEGCRKFTARLIQGMDKKRKSNVSELLAMTPYSYQDRIIKLRTAQIRNAVTATKTLEREGFGRHEVMDMLRIVPFNRWLAFAKRYGRELGKDLAEKRRKQIDERYGFLTKDQFDSLKIKAATLGTFGEKLTAIYRDFLDRTRHNTLAYLTGGGLMGALESTRTEISTWENSEDTIRLFDSFLFRTLSESLKIWVGDTANVKNPQTFIRSLIRGFADRNYHRDEDSPLTRRGAEVFAFAMKDAFPGLISDSVESLAEALIKAR